jgi:hypothetical protein
MIGVNGGRFHCRNSNAWKSRFLTKGAGMEFEINSSDDQVEMAFASWVRILQQAPIQNRPSILAMMARDAREWADGQRRQAMHDLYFVAVQTGLVKLLGSTHVKAVILDVFGGAA